MSARLISRYADDPKVVTFVVVALVAAALWLATWQTMSGMSGMSEMPGGMTMDSGTNTMGGMSDTGTANGGMAGMAGSTAEPGSKPMTMDMPGMSMNPADWSLSTIATTTAMWILMMAAMMAPAMAPVIAIYAGLAAKEDKGTRLALRIFLFSLGYFMLWAIFSVAAALGQLGLRSSDWFVMGGTQALPFAAGILLIVAGAYQFTPVKEFCLAHCRHPLAYLLSHWREGLSGAFPVGARHGVYCLGCCIALMGLMFVFGAMNVAWMAAIAVYFLAEKVLPKVEIWGRIAGGLLILAGVVTLVREFI
jgi:predicted metal-binding membrane protein